MAKKAKATEYVLPVGKALVLRTCNADMTSAHEAANGFKWPKSGAVVATDWDPSPQCGHGLHGLLWGEGDASLLSFDDVAKWLVVEIDQASAVDLCGKIKFPRGMVVFVGDRFSAPKWLGEHGGAGRAIVSGTATAGVSGTATAGDCGTATAGVSGTATAGANGTATAGDCGTATAGANGTATAGVRGTATAGYRGTAKTGDVGIIVVRWHDVQSNRARLTVGYVGEDGIEANTLYRCNDLGNLVKV